MKLLFLGDIMCHDKQLRLAYDRETDSYDFTKSFEMVKTYFGEFDHVVCNLETVITQGPWNGYPKFSTPDEFVRDMKYANIDVCCLANNHCNDMGEKGIAHTIQCLDTYGMRYTGVSTGSSPLPIVLDNEVAIINFTTKLNCENTSSHIFINYAEDAELFRTSVDELKQTGFTGKIICVVHWGNEYKKYSSDEQEELAIKLIEYGADLIIGSHPHVVQDSDLLQNTHIIYSLGNALSSQPEEDCVTGLAVEVEVNEHTIEISKRQEINNYIYIYKK